MSELKHRLVTIGIAVATALLLGTAAIGCGDDDNGAGGTGGTAGTSDSGIDAATIDAASGGTGGGGGTGGTGGAPDEDGGS